MFKGPHLPQHTNMTFLGEKTVNKEYLKALKLTSYTVGLWEFLRVQKGSNPRPNLNTTGPQVRFGVRIFWQKNRTQPDIGNTTLKTKDG
jgi:hypothetical protein